MMAPIHSAPLAAVRAHRQEKEKAIGERKTARARTREQRVESVFEARGLTKGESGKDSNKDSRTDKERERHTN